MTIIQYTTMILTFILKFNLIMQTTWYKQQSLLMCYTLHYTMLGVMEYLEAVATTFLLGS